MHSNQSPSLALTRRSFALGAGALLVCGAPAQAIVQERFQTLMRRVMGLTWIGRSHQKSDMFAGGDLAKGVGMKFALNDDWSYRGSWMEVIRLDGNEYTGIFRISGECWTIADDAGVSIYRMEFVRGTPLPDGLAWGTSTGDFRFSGDTDRKGHFVLQGETRYDRDGTRSRVTLIDSE